MIFVLEATGKRDEVEFITLKVFDTEEEAEAHCQEVFRVGKYWRNAIIVPVGKEFDIMDLAEDDIGNLLWHLD